MVHIKKKDSMIATTTTILIIINTSYRQDKCNQSNVSAKMPSPLTDNKESLSSCNRNANYTQRHLQARQVTVKIYKWKGSRVTIINARKLRKTHKNIHVLYTNVCKKFFFYRSMIIICNKNHKQLGCAVNSKTKLYIMLLR